MSPAISAQTERALALVNQYKNAQSLLTVFNPTQQIDCTEDLNETYRGNAPSLVTVKDAFGGGTARSWLVIQLNDLSEFAGCKDKLPIKKIEEVANIFISEYEYLKLTELMDFFRKFKLGSYGKFYGSVDPMVITCAMIEFMKDRAGILKRLEMLESEKRKALDPEHICWNRKMRAYERKKKFYSYNFRSKDFTYEEFSEIWWLFNLGYERKDHGYVED